MTDVKLKSDDNGDNYGSISLGQNVTPEKNSGFFSGLRSRWNYEKMQEENKQIVKTPSLLSMVSGLHETDAF